MANTHYFGDNFIFLILSIGSIILAFFVILSARPIISGIFLILTYFSVSLWLLYLGQEFFAYLYLIVYVGAVAVLLLFVIMMTDLGSKIIKNKKKDKIYYIAIFLFFVMAQIIHINFAGVIDYLKVADGGSLYVISQNSFVDTRTHLLQYSVTLRDGMSAVGLLMYTKYQFHFMYASFVLLIGMLGAIVISMQARPKYRLQDSFSQLNNDANRYLASYRRDLNELKK